MILKYKKWRVDISPGRVLGKLMQRASQAYDMELKGDIRDLSTFTPIQQDIIRSMMTGSGMGAYTQLWVIHKCIAMTAEMVADLVTKTVTLNDKAGEQKQEKVWDKITGQPNRLDTWFDILEQMVTYLQLDGNTYIYRPDVGLTPDFWILESRNITPEWIGKGIEREIIYKDRADNKTYTEKEITHIKYFNPSNRLKGQSPLTASSNDMKFARLLDIYKNALYENQGTPSGVVSVDGTMTPAGFNQMKKEINEQIMGARNAGVPLLFENGAKYDSIGIPPADLKLIESENMTASNLATALGVPVEMLGALGKDSKTYSNYEQAPKDYILRTIIPTANRILRAIEHDYFYESGLKPKINENLIPQLKPKVAEIKDAYWTTVNQKRSMQGLIPIEGPNADMILVPSNLVPLDMLAFEDKGNL